jgi:hypothetical protein
MFDHDSHITDQDLIRAADGELFGRVLSRTQRHLVHCWACRSRMKAIEEAIAGFVRVYHDSVDPQLPDPRGARSLLQARLSQLAAEHPPTPWRRITGSLFVRRLASAACIFVIALATTIWWQSSKSSLASSPDPRLTPGAALPLSEADLCSKVQAPKSRSLSASVVTKVFEEYGIRNPRRHVYELDYLIDPELGGSDDERNLWPEPYSPVWNAHVKDALEAHLRELVCKGKVALAQAQHDIAEDWIGAYKTYFHTDHPLAEHLSFTKDEPWE